MTILAIDQGTTSTRAVELRENGELRVLHTVAHRQIYPRPGWVEHDPDELLANIVTCLSAAGAAEAVGLANQGESCLAWDAATGRPVSPVIVWQDERTAADTERLRAAGAEALTLTRAGLPLDPYFSASKLGWILRHVPEAQALARQGRLRLGTTDAFFRQRLTGLCATDATTASRTSLMNLATCTWDAELCALFGVPVEALPEIGPTSGDLGRIAGRPFAASVVDQQAALAGHGCRAPGDAKITFGTGAFVLAVAGAEAPAPGRGPLPTVAWQRGGEAPVYALEGGVYAAAAALNWSRGLGLFSDWDEIGAFEAPPAVSRGLVFVPALAGMACPHWDRRAKGAWMGMALETGPRDLVQAILEGVAFRTAEVVGAMEAQVPLSATLSIDGGMTRNAWFCQFLSDTLGKRLLVSGEPELTALGVARLAAEGRGRRIDHPVDGRFVEPRAQPAEWFGTFAEAGRLVRAFGRRAMAESLP
jgi:glycerol kinase